MQVGAIRPEPFQGIEIFRIDVRGPVGSAWDQMQSHIADARADFQHTISHIGPDYVRHPASETWRTIQTKENFPAVRIGFVKLVGKRIAENGPQSTHAVLPIDFLAFGVS